LQRLEGPAGISRRGMIMNCNVGDFKTEMRCVWPPPMVHHTTRCPTRVKIPVCGSHLRPWRTLDTHQKPYSSRHVTEAMKVRRVARVREPAWLSGLLCFRIAASASSHPLAAALHR
jgi:hypothetical protein